MVRGGLGTCPPLLPWGSDPSAHPAASTARRCVDHERCEGPPVRLCASVRRENERPLRPASGWLTLAFEAFALAAPPQGWTRLLQQSAATPRSAPTASTSHARSALRTCSRSCGARSGTEMDVLAAFALVYTP